MNNAKPLDSYPFLSGDSFFYSCEFFFKSGALHNIQKRNGRPQKQTSIFVKISDVKEFISFLMESPTRNFLKFSIVLHNGDENIEESILELLASKVRKVYAVNILTKSEKFVPIPIGLENRRYFTNGVPKDFEKLLSIGLPKWQNREISILQAFSMHTNPKERETCSQIAVQLGARILEQASPQEYKRTLTQSKFVLSPAGNGFDCHRTWEAIYFGAIPIVKRSNWPFVHKKLPVILVAEWHDLLDMDLHSINVSRGNDWQEDFWDEFFES
jgi:hypothetical protein